MRTADSTQFGLGKRNEMDLGVGEYGEYKNSTVE